MLRIIAATGSRLVAQRTTMSSAASTLHSSSTQRPTIRGIVFGKCEGRRCHWSGAGAAATRRRPTAAPEPSQRVYINAAAPHMQIHWAAPPPPDHADMDGTLTQAVIDFAEMRRRVAAVAQPPMESLTGGDILAIIGSWPAAQREAAHAAIASVEQQALRDMQLMPGVVELSAYLDVRACRVGRVQGSVRGVVTARLPPSLQSPPARASPPGGGGPERCVGANAATGAAACCCCMQGVGVPRALVTRNVSSSIDFFHAHHFTLPPFVPALSRDCIEPKPSPASLLHIAERWGVAPGELVMVGDSAKDDVRTPQKGVVVVVVFGGERSEMSVCVCERGRGPGLGGCLRQGLGRSRAGLPLRCRCMGVGGRVPSPFIPRTSGSRPHSCPLPLPCRLCAATGRGR